MKMPRGPGSRGFPGCRDGRKLPLPAGHFGHQRGSLRRPLGPRGHLTGTRDGGARRRFKDGAFRLAIETGTPVLPMVLWGTKDAMLKKDWRFGHADAEVRVLEPVPVDGLTLDDVEALKMQVRDLMVRELANR